MKIPKKIKLVDTEVAVSWNPKLHYKDDCRGMSSYREDAIELQPSTKEWPETDSEIIGTFFHELTHWVLHKMKSDKSNDEVFVELFASILHQALVSGEIITDVVENKKRL